MEGNRIAADEFSAVVRQLYRMFKTGTIHLMNNEAVTQSIGQTVRVVNRLAEQGLDEISILFLNDTVFVNGTLLKAGREIYEAALDLGVLLRRAGANEMSVSTAATVEDLSVVVGYASEKMRADVREDEAHQPLPRFGEGASLRLIDPELLEDVQTGSMTARDRVGRTYASTLVIMRFLYDGLKEGRYAVSRQLKRLTQQLVLLADEDPKAFLGITRMRNVQDDEAGRAVNSAILAILAARELTTDVKTISRVALSALMADIGRPRAAGMGKGGGSDIAVIPMLSDEQRRGLPRDTVVAVAAVGRLHDESLHRTVVGYEAQWLANKRVLGELYDGEYVPCLESTLVYMVRRFNELITYDVYSQSRMAPDDAMRVLRRSASDETERRCADLLFQALGLVPRGSVVELSSGHVGVVIENSDKPGLYGLPSVQIFADENGKRVNGILVDLAKPSRDVLRYGGIRRVREDLESPSDLPQVEHAAPPTTRPISKPSARKRALPDSIRRRVANDSDFDLDDDIVVEMTEDFDGPRLELSDDIEVAPIEAMEVRARDIVSMSDSGAVSAVPLGTGDFEPVVPPRPDGAGPPPPPPAPAAAAERLAVGTTSSPHPVVDNEPRSVTPSSIPSPRLSTPADRKPVVQAEQTREVSYTPAASPAVTTGALPVVTDFSESAPEQDAGDELDSMLESYFGSPPKRTDTDGELPKGVHQAEHSLPGEAIMGTARVAPTGPLPMPTADPTGDLSEPVAHNLLRNYFPESEVPKKSEFSQENIPRGTSSGPNALMPRSSDTQVENVPNPHQILSSHFPDANPQPRKSARPIESVETAPVERDPQTLGTQFEAPNFDSVLPTEPSEAPIESAISDSGDVPALDELIPVPVAPPSAPTPPAPEPTQPAPVESSWRRPKGTSAPARPATPQPVDAPAAPAAASAELESLLSSYLSAEPAPVIRTTVSVSADDLLAAYLAGEAPPRRAIMRRKPKLGAVVERTSGVNQTGEARRVRASLRDGSEGGAPNQPETAAAAAEPAALTPERPEPAAAPTPAPSRQRSGPVAGFQDVEDGSAGLEALRNYSEGEADDALDAIRVPAVSLAGEVGNDDLTPPPQPDAIPEGGRTMFGSPASLGLQDLADTAPDARPVAAEPEPTRRISGRASNQLLSGFDTPGAQRAVADTRPASDLAVTPLPEPAAAPPAPPAPPVSAAPPVMRPAAPDLGPDTMEVDDAHATEVLRDFLRDRSATPGGTPIVREPASSKAAPGKNPETPVSQRSVVTPPAVATVEMGAAAADALLEAYSGSREAVPSDEETEPETPAAPDATREVGSRKASDLLSRYVKPDDK